MSKLRRTTGRALRAALKRAGFEVIRSKGSIISSVIATDAQQCFLSIRVKTSVEDLLQKSFETLSLARKSFGNGCKGIPRRGYVFEANLTKVDIPKDARFLTSSCQQSSFNLIASHGDWNHTIHPQHKEK